MRLRPERRRDDSARKTAVSAVRKTGVRRFDRQRPAGEDGVTPVFQQSTLMITFHQRTIKVILTVRSVRARLTRALFDKRQPVSSRRNRKS